VNDQIYIGVEFLIVSTTEYLWCAFTGLIKTTPINSSRWTYLPIVLYLNIVMYVAKLSYWGMHASCLCLCLSAISCL
jgi:sensor histidine kinase YesM